MFVRNIAGRLDIDFYPCIPAKNTGLTDRFSVFGLLCRLKKNIELLTIKLISIIFYQLGPFLNNISSDLQICWMASLPEKAAGGNPPPVATQ